MRKVNPINIYYAHVVEQYLTDTISGAYNEHRSFLNNCANEYISKAHPEFSLHEIKESKLTYRSLVSYYENEFVNGQFRKIYNKIRATTSRCPHCGSNKITCLDHYLPKEKYNQFAIFPYNLIPSCKDCNEAKGAYSTNEHEKLLLHPYYDDINNNTWLGCKIIDHNPIVTQFYIIENPNDDISTKRIKNHFSKLKLDIMYENNASDEIIGIHLELHKLFLIAGKDGVAASLRERADSWAAPFKNSWQAALYRGLSEDDWYCGVYIAISAH